MARPRGFATWDPRPETLALVGQIQTVLDEYENFLPVTARQIFYRLVGEHGFDKTEQAYSRLCEALVRARRAGMVPFASIRDDGTAGGPPVTFAGVRDFWRSVRDDVKHYSRDRLNGQVCRIELWCEAGGMVPQLQRVAYPYSVPVYSTGGFSSVTVTHEIARRALQRDVPTIFLHCGDWDPSGESIFEAQATDAEEFVAMTVGSTHEKGSSMLAKLMGLRADQVGEKAELIPVRIALTEAQVDEHQLPTAPPKRSDSRSVNWSTQTCQLEAMPPDLLAETVREAIREELDLARYEKEVGEEKADEDRIYRGIEAAEAVEPFPNDNQEE